MQVKYKFFQSTFASWKSMFQDAADFASLLPTDRVISISHSADKGEGVVVVWYWADDDPATPEAAP